MSMAPTHFVAGDRFVPWLDQMPSAWSFQPLKYLVRINARTLGEETEPETCIDYIDISSVDSEGLVIETTSLTFGTAPSRARRVLMAGDVFISTVRTYLTAIAFCDARTHGFICSTGFAVLTPGMRVLPKFLFYWTRSSSFVGEIVARSTGVSYPAINASEIGNLPFPLLDLEHQQTIVDYLDRRTDQIDSLIGKRVRQIELIHEKRRALISQAVSGGTDAGVHLSESGLEWLGRVPESWCVSKLLFLLRERPKNGISPPHPTTSEGVPTFSIAAVRDGVVRINDHLKSTDLNLENARDYLVHVGDILVIRGNANQDLVGRCGMVSEHPPGCVYPDLLIRIKPNGLIDPIYLVFFLNSALGRRQMEMSAKTSNGTLKISGEDLASIKILLPPRREQLEILHTLSVSLDQVDKLIGLVRTQTEKLIEFRLALITAAVTGKLDVPTKADAP